MLLQVENVFLSYLDGLGLHTVLNNINLEFADKGLYAISGPSGSGKSSLLYILSGLVKPDAGLVYFQKQALPTSSNARAEIRRKFMGFVFQSHFLIPYLTVSQNILVGLDKISADTNFKLLDLLKVLKISEIGHRFPNQISGGQKQRVVIARALISNPRVLFVDEPTANLDHNVGGKIIALLAEISKSTCVIMVTHDEANLRLADKVFRIWDGKIQTQPFHI